MNFNEYRIPSGREYVIESGWPTRPIDAESAEGRGSRFKVELPLGQPGQPKVNV